MNNKKKEEKRKRRRLLTMAERMKLRGEGVLKNWQKNPKNKDKKPLS